jgi:hypothetical protein
LPFDINQIEIYDESYQCAKTLIERTAIESPTREGKKPHENYHRYTLHTVDDCNRARGFQAGSGNNPEVASEGEVSRVLKNHGPEGLESA